MLKEARVKKPKTSDQIVKYVVGGVAREFVAAVAAAHHCANILIKYNQNGRSGRSEDAALRCKLRQTDSPYCGILLIFHIESPTMIIAKRNQGLPCVLLTSH